MTELTLPPRLAHPFSPSGRVDPHPAYRWFQENSPVYFDKLSRFWLVTGHAECTAALSDRRFSASLGQRERMRDDDLPASMLTSDSPDHRRLRAPGALLLGPAALRQQDRGLDEAVNRVLGGLAGRSEVDAAADIGEPFAAEVLAGLFTLPAELKPAFASLARKVSVNLDPLAGPTAGAAGRAAVDEFTAFMDRHIQTLRAAGQDCPLTRLADDRRLSHAEMLGIISLSVIGGFLPLADLIGHAAYWITASGKTFASLADGIPAGRSAADRCPADHSPADHSPADLSTAGRRADGPERAELTSPVIDELMRLATPIPFTARVTTDPAELGGVRLPPGSRVLFVIAAANRDPSVFANPGRYEPRRSPNPHLAFGAGPHLCLGAPLVRWAGGALLRELAARFPEARQIGTAEWDKPLVPRRLRHQRIALHR